MSCWGNGNGSEGKGCTNDASAFFGLSKYTAIHWGMEDWAGKE